MLFSPPWLRGRRGAYGGQSALPKLEQKLRKFMFTRDDSTDENGHRVETMNDLIGENAGILDLEGIIVLPISIDF